MTKLTTDALTDLVKAGVQKEVETVVSDSLAKEVPGVPAVPDVPGAVGGLLAGLLGGSFRGGGFLGLVFRLLRFLPRR
jgi:hypothetical protein